MKFLVILFLLASIKGFAYESIAGKGLICAYGKNKQIYEGYLFFNRKYISKFLYLEKNRFKIRQNEKRNYTISKDSINLYPFKININSFQVIDTEFNKVIGSCFLKDTHEKVNSFMNKLKFKTQESYNKNLKGHEI